MIKNRNKTPPKQILANNTKLANNEIKKQNVNVIKYENTNIKEIVNIIY